MSIETYMSSCMNAFGTPWAQLARGEGVYVWDEAGKKYIDLLGGIAVNALGHAHPAIIAAVTKQIGQLGHVSNFFATEPQIELASRLRDLYRGETGAEAKVFFTNSGTEANEAALKIAMLSGPGRIVALTHGFHGRTLGALSVTHKPAIREPFDQIGDVEFIDARVDAFDSLDGKVRAIIVETIQGEAGVVPLGPEVMKAARRAADRLGALLIVDEVQTGIGRCGAWFAHTDHVTADVVTLAKGLGGGLPIGAVLATEPAADLLTPGSHGTTFGGNPIACAAALAVLDEVGKLMDHISTTGQWLAEQVSKAGLTVRGQGLLLGVEVPDAPDLVVALRERGIITQAPNDATLRLAPPLIITTDQLVSPIAEITRLTNRSWA